MIVEVLGGPHNGIRLITRDGAKGIIFALEDFSPMPERIDPENVLFKHIKLNIQPHPRPSEEGQFVVIWPEGVK